MDPSRRWRCSACPTSCSYEISSFLSLRFREFEQFMSGREHRTRWEIEAFRKAHRTKSGHSLQSGRSGQSLTSQQEVEAWRNDPYHPVRPGHVVIAEMDRARRESLASRGSFGGNSQRGGGGGGSGRPSRDSRGSRR